MIVLLSALEEEIRELKKRMLINKTSCYQSCRIYQGGFYNRDNMLALTGIGKEHAEKATKFILDTFPVSALVSTGFGGALNEKTGAGDIIVYSKLCCEESRTRPSEEDLWCNSNLVSAASRSKNGASFHSLLGDGVTVSTVCNIPQSKRKLGQDFSADVVDMESYWIGQIAADRKIPFLAVRSIFDAQQDDLSFLDHIVVEGKVRPLRALSHFVFHPGQLKHLADYSSNYRKAGKNLATFLTKLVQEIQSEVEK